MQLKDFIEDKTYLSIEAQLDNLSFESYAFKDVLPMFRNLLPNLLDQIKSINLNNKDDEEYSAIIKQIKKTNINLSKKIKFANFGTYNKLLVSIPENFKGYFLNYLILLDSLNKDIYENGIEILTNYNTILSTFISNKEDKISMKDYTNLYKDAAKKRENILNQLSLYFDDNKASKNYLENVIERFADLDNLEKEVTNFDKAHNKQNMSNITSLVDKSVELLNLIILNSESEIKNISGSAAINISKGAYEVGKYVELISIYRFKSEQLLTSINRLFTDLDMKIK